MNERAMIDTVRYVESRTYSCPLSLRLATCGGRVFLPGFKVVPAAGLDSFLIIHKKTKLRAKFCAKILAWVEVSLPKVLFDNNGKLLSSQSDIRNAFRRVDGILNSFSTSGRSGRIFRRVDLVWQFSGEPVLYANAHRNCFHPMIRKPVVDYGNNGLAWKGSQVTIRMYDKLLEQTKKTGDVVRVEVQLRGKKLRQVLANDAPVAKLDFVTCYIRYKSIVQKFQPQSVPDVRDPIDLLAYAQTEHGVNLWHHWKAHYKNPQSRNRVRREYLARKLRYSEIDWDDVLPARRPLWKAETDLKNGSTYKIAIITGHPISRICGK